MCKACSRKLRVIISFAAELREEGDHVSCIDQEYGVPFIFRPLCIPCSCWTSFWFSIGDIRAHRGNGFSCMIHGCMKRPIFVISDQLENGDNIKSDVDFLLWTKDNPLEPDILEVGNLSALAASHFQRDLPTRILIHGYEDTGTTGWVLTVRNSYFNKGTA